MYRDIIKPFLDFVLSITGLLILSPLFLIVSILIKLDSSGPIFFTQYRLGRNNKLFKIFKFRTMKDKKRENRYEIFKDNPEVTKIGKILRRYKIDELPQLINVLFGHLSLVGPRPWLPDVLKEIDMDKLCIRSKVKPGLTGLAQINGNIYIPNDERLRFDIQYVQNLSFIMDVKILLKTLLVIIFGEEKFKKNV